MELWNREKQRRLREYPKLDYKYEKGVILAIKIQEGGECL